ncbi:MAG: hypothetical protein KDC38_08395 [Planctomycetes bacterium]|nr:hypothetical protein [Planctomycetota bacterium]
MATDADGASLSGRLSIGERSTSWTRDGAEGGVEILLAHGSGASCRHPFMEATARGLVERGHRVTRFNFPYMEQQERTGKRRPPDRAPTLLQTWDAIIGMASGWSDAGPLVLMGKSMGGRMASMWLADHPRSAARATVYLGYPLHPPGKSERLRSEHLSRIDVPQLFVQGTRDELATWSLLEPLVDQLPGAELFRVEGGDHALATSPKEPLGSLPQWLEAIEEFLRRQIV